jgi:Protein of unknown function (DUF2516)
VGVRIDYWIELVLSWAAVPVGLFAFIHAAVQKADAYSAAGKRTKPFWLGLTAAGTVCCALFPFYGIIPFLWMGGLVAVLVYIVDVKPAVAEVQRGSQW